MTTQLFLFLFLFLYINNIMNPRTAANGPHEEKQHYIPSYILSRTPGSVLRSRYLHSQAFFFFFFSKALRLVMDNFPSLNLIDMVLPTTAAERQRAGFRTAHEQSSASKSFVRVEKLTSPIAYRSKVVRAGQV